MDSAPGLLVSEAEFTSVDKLAAAEWLALAMVLTILALNVSGWVVAVPAAKAGWRSMYPGAVVAAFLSVLGLHCSMPGFGKHMRRASRFFAVCLVLECAMILAAHIRHAGPAANAGGLAAWLRMQLAPESAAAFAVLGIALLLIRARGLAAGLAADALAAGVLLSALTLASAHFLGQVQFFGAAAPDIISSPVVLCLLLLSAVTFFRRARQGVFSILFGRRAGSRLARILAPVLLVLPYLREALRARLIGVRHMPSDYATAILATAAVGISTGLLFFLAWRINQMESEVQDLSLRDPLTGLYNLRGFRLLAEQALLLAHRSGQPFSVLFIDLDNLKRTNDELGHQAGSDFLVDTAGILNGAFRETDVLARIGGDEFAAAGLLDQAAIAQAAQRLLDAAAERNQAAAQPIDLSFSVGYVTSEASRRASLDELLALADQAMYEDKRRRKALQNDPLFPPESRPWGSAAPISSLETGESRQVH